MWEKLMAEIIYIREHEDPPAGLDWVLVERTPSGKYVGHGSVAQGQSPKYYTSPAEDREAALSRAIAWADSHSIPKVYFREPDNDA
jgi:hypothetical protein